MFVAETEGSIWLRGFNHIQRVHSTYHMAQWPQLQNEKKQDR